FHVASRVRVSEVLPQEQVPSFFVQVEVGRAKRGRRRQIELKCLVPDIAETPSTTRLVRPVIFGRRAHHWHIHVRANRTRTVAPEHESVLSHAQMFLNADIAKTFDSKFCGLPSSDEFVGCHGASQVSTLRELAPSQKRHDAEQNSKSHDVSVRLTVSRPIFLFTDALA